MHARVMVLLLSCLLSFSLLAKVEQGKIDLSSTFLASGETINLQGEWFFSPRQWLKPDQSFEQQFLQVPGTWKQQLGNAKGIASYSVQITMPLHSSTHLPHYAILIKNLSAAWKLYINGEYVAESGKISLTAHSEQAGKKYQVIPLPTTEKTVSLLLHISNHTFGDGGIKRSIQFGTIQTIDNLVLEKVLLSAILFSGFSFLFIYLLTFYVIYPKELAYLFLGLYCACIALFMLRDSHLMAFLLPDIDAVLRYRITWGAMALLMPAYALYLRKIFAFPSQYKWLLAPLAFNICCLVMMIVSPSDQLLKVLDAALASSIIIQVMASYFIFYCWRHKHPNSGIALLINIGFLAAIIHDAWLAVLRVQDQYLMSIALPLCVSANVIFFAIINHKRYLDRTAISKILEHRIHLKTHQLSKSLNRLTKADQEKERFFHYLCHEFRLPLTLILDPLKGLYNQRYGSLSNQVKQAVTLAHDNTQQLLNLTNQLLDTNKNQSIVSAKNIETLDLSVSVNQVIERIACYFESKNIKITLHNLAPDPSINISAHHLESILLNLLSNAFKYTPVNGNIDVTISYNQQLELQIKNQTSNFNESQLDQFFNAFYRGDQTDSEQQGNGLGLALVEQLVKHYQGKISLHYHVPWVIVDLSFDTVSIQPTNHSDSTFSSKLSSLNTTTNSDSQKDHSELILVVEDHQQTRDYLAQILSHHGYRVLTAKDGLQGFSMCLKHQPDLLISDYIMPQLDGVGLIQKVRRQPLIQHTPIIIITSQTATQQQVNAINQGADDYIVKPFIQEELLVRIDRHLTIRRELKADYRTQQSTHSNKQRSLSFKEQLEKLIDDHIDQDTLNVSFLADKLAMDRTTLHRKVKQRFGCSTSDLIKRQRLATAKTLLTEQTSNIAEIAFQTGFNSQAYFASQFKKQFNCTPKEWRAKHSLHSVKNSTF